MSRGRQILPVVLQLTFYRAGYHRARRLIKGLTTKLRIRTAKPLRLVLGSGTVRLPGWILTDIDHLNILLERDWERLFSPNSIDAIIAEHVWEHLTMKDGLDAARFCFRYLRVGGYLRIAVPDGLHPDPTYIDAVRPGGNGAGADDHKELYSWRTLRTLFINAGFDVTLLEYFDEQGNFHEAGWEPADGTIFRSKRFDERNKDGALRYTSIILDARKLEKPISSFCS